MMPKEVYRDHEKLEKMGIIAKVKETREGFESVVSVLNKWMKNLGLDSEVVHVVQGDLHDSITVMESLKAEMDVEYDLVRKETEKREIDLWTFRESGPREVMFGVRVATVDRTMSFVSLTHFGYSA